MSATFDYSVFDPALDLIRQFGANCTLSRAASNAGRDAWVTNQNPTADSGAQSVTVPGVRTGLDKEAVSLAAVGTRLATFVLQTSADFVEELDGAWALTSAADGKTYEVLVVRPVQPGTPLLLYFVTVLL